MPKKTVELRVAEQALLAAEANGTPAVELAPLIASVTAIKVREDRRKWRTQNKKRKKQLVEAKPAIREDGEDEFIWEPPPPAVLMPQKPFVEAAPEPAPELDAHAGHGVDCLCPHCANGHHGFGETRVLSAFEFPNNDSAPPRSVIGDPTALGVSASDFYLYNVERVAATQTLVNGVPLSEIEAAERAKELNAINREVDLIDLRAGRLSITEFNAKHSKKEGGN
jgi:hypothetical protein